MAFAKDEWVATALTDDHMVVELLLRFNHAEMVVSGNNPAVNLPLLRWSFRKRRSRIFGFGVEGFLKKETESARASPMTPLCWSGGSGSGGSSCPSAATGDGFEDTSRQASCSISTGSGSKTFLKHQDAENLQLKKRLNLEKMIVNATYDDRSAKNQTLKRIKLQYSDRVKNIPICKSNLGESCRKRGLPSSISQVKNEEHVSKSYIASNKTKGFFFLPDLNMTPNEEDELLYGTS